MQKVVISPYPHQHFLCLLYFLVKKGIFSVFSSRSFIVSGLMFKFSIHSQLVFVNGIREESSLILLHMIIQVLQYHLLKSLSFPHLVFLAPLSYIIGAYMRVCLWAVAFVPLDYVSVFMPVPYCFKYCSFAIYLEIRKCDTLAFSMFQGCFGYSGGGFQTYFRIFFLFL